MKSISSILSSATIIHFLSLFFSLIDFSLIYHLLQSNQQIIAWAWLRPRYDLQGQEDRSRRRWHQISVIEKYQETLRVRSRIRGQGRDQVTNRRGWPTSHRPTFTRRRQDMCLAYSHSRCPRQSRESRWDHAFWKIQRQRDGVCWGSPTDR